MRPQQKPEDRDVTLDLERRKQESYIPEQKEEDAGDTEDIEDKKQESESE